VLSTGSAVMFLRRGLSFDAAVCAFTELSVRVLFQPGFLDFRGSEWSLVGPAPPLLAKTGCPSWSSVMRSRESSGGRSPVVAGTGFPVLLKRAMRSRQFVRTGLSNRDSGLLLAASVSTFLSMRSTCSGRAVYFSTYFEGIKPVSCHRHR
jgi:hypothetical protein